MENISPVSYDIYFVLLILVFAFVYVNSKVTLERLALDVFIYCDKYMLH